MTRQNQAIYDTLLELHDGAAAVTADGNGQVDGSAKIMDLGAEVFRSEWAGQAMMPAAELVIEVTELDETTGDETYVVVFELSNSSSFGSGNFEFVRVPITATGRYIVPVLNQQLGQQYRYCRVKFDVGGTTPSITCVARLTKKRPW